MVVQDKMVKGMHRSLVYGFAVVFLLLSILFRSPLRGLLAMIPPAFSIAII